MRGWIWAGVAASMLLSACDAAEDTASDQDATADMDMAMNTHHAEQIVDFEMMKGKFLQLAEAFPEDTYDWHPMEGVRSVRDLMSHTAAEGFIFPTLWGVDPPEGVTNDWGVEMPRLGAMSKAELIVELERAFDHVIASCEGLTDEQLMGRADWFGTEMSVTGLIARASGDMHEHLGQAIAYARMNEIVPPWSQ